MNRALYPLSFLYSFLRGADKTLSKPKKLSRPVISVGNLTCGGTGKTPLVIEIAKFAAGRNKRAAVLTRGYGRKSKEPVLLKDGALNADIASCGDEALLIAKSVPQASVIIGANRFSNALKFENETKTDFYILDDGFQHWHISRNLDIVCINAANPFGNGFLIPAGILREPVNALKRADLIIITNSDAASAEQISYIKSKIKEFSNAEPIISRYGGYRLKQLNLLDDFDIEKDKDKKFYSLSAIGFDGGFKNSLKKAGFKIERHFQFRDHFNFTRQSLEKVFESADGIVIVTAKDAVKIEKAASADMKAKFAVLSVSPIFEYGKDLWEEKILKVLQSF
ncbi:MAG: tetraacyldisaccharide 4'-kinase [Elusimicrobiota bacterium]|nr:tetraacyldisaccharide 4'-kinase [Elusimicrobiota bacterium]